VLTAPLVMLTLWNRSFGASDARGLDAGRYLAAAVDAVLAALRPARGGKSAARRERRTSSRTIP
jgi:hypothetical protein